MEYKPKYARGQILVVFKNRCNDRFARDFGKTLGYQLMDEKYEHGEAYLFKTELGKEQEAKKKFAAHFEFVDWAELRDIKIETRWSGLEQAIIKIQELYDNVEIPDDFYSQKLEEIRHYLKQLKDSHLNTTETHTTVSSKGLPKIKSRLNKL
ncbi:MAG: hypothetical protein PHV68_09150 [Candidatus Gastranaerophilales bacterium]|jgi:hypothetical protein|nr:hypothetical protein [Candidatus Gastranaerophilales bacterium]